jgi:CheY-like chemotaxis protein
MSKVLVVDDDPGIALLLKRIISKKGHEIVTAGNGWEGLKLAQEEIPDLIFTDVRMPDLGGVELAGFLKADPNLQHIPVIILSGTAFLLELEKTSADDILTKPFDLKSVYAMLERYLGPGANSNSPQNKEAAKDHKKEGSGLEGEGNDSNYPSVSEPSQGFSNH